MANVSRSIFDEQKRYVMSIVQQGIPWIDADENDGRQGLYNSVRQTVNFLIGRGVPPTLPNAFDIQEASVTANNFLVKGGGTPGTPLTAARLWSGGHQCVLYDDTDFVTSGATVGQQSFFSRSTSLTALVLTDQRRNWEIDELVGREIVPNVSEPSTTYTITGNTATTLTITTGDLTADASGGDFYRVNPATPAGAREDGVYIDVYLVEINSDQDPNLKNNIEGLIETQIRSQVQQIIHVREDVPTHGDMADYVDFYGEPHYVMKLARIDRLSGNANITNAMITDLRPYISLSGNELVKIDGADTVAGFLDDKLEVVTATGLTKTTLGAGNERIQLALDGTVRVNASDTTHEYLATKVVGTGTVSVTPVDTGAGDYELQVAAISPGAISGLVYHSRHVASVANATVTMIDFNPIATGVRYGMLTASVSDRVGDWQDTGTASGWIDFTGNPWTISYSSNFILDVPYPVDAPNANLAGAAFARNSGSSYVYASAANPVTGRLTISSYYNTAGHTCGFAVTLILFT